MSIIFLIYLFIFTIQVFLMAEVEENDKKLAENYYSTVRVCASGEGEPQPGISGESSNGTREAQSSTLILFKSN